jgi:hypothetical protein
MKRLTLSFTITLIVIAGILASGVSYAAEEEGTLYAVTITNITRGQIISPPVVISHNKDFQLFSLGEPATTGIGELAEDANVEPLIAHISTLSSVYEYVMAEDAIPPGGSVTLGIMVQKDFKLISALGMLVTTNDTFFAIRDEKAPILKGKIVEAEAYDSGTEVNSELCEFIPGPPCGNGGVRDPEGAEGFVHIHAGIHGIGDLAPEEFDWRNPVAEIIINPIK